MAANRSPDPAMEVVVLLARVFLLWPGQWIQTTLSKVSRSSIYINTFRNFPMKVTTTACCVDQGFATANM